MTARTDETYVQVPRALLRSTSSPLDVAVWCVIASYRKWRTNATSEAYPSRARVMERIGREGIDPMPVSRATDRLQRAGQLSKRRAYVNGKWRTYYQLSRPEQYVELPTDVLDLLRADNARRITPELLRSQLRWMDLCGGSGWTRDSLSQFSETFPGASTRTAKAHRSALVRHELLQVETWPGKPTVTRVPWLFATGAESRSLTAHPTALTGAELRSQPGQNPTPDRGGIMLSTGAESGSEPGQDPAQGTTSRGTTSRETTSQDQSPVDPASHSFIHASSPSVGVGRRSSSIQPSFSSVTRGAANDGWMGRDEMNDSDAKNRQIDRGATVMPATVAGEQCDAPTDLNDAPTRKPARSLSGLQAYLRRLDPAGWRDVCEAVGLAQGIPPGQRRELRAMELVVAQLPQRNYAQATDEQLTDALTSVYVITEEQPLQATDEARNSA